MTKFFIKVLLITLTFFFSNTSFGAHIIGGDATYKCKGVSADGKMVTFEVIFTLYRDSRGGGAQFDNPFSFGIYRKSGNSYSRVRSIDNIYVSNTSNIDVQNENPCIIAPVNIGVQKGVYKFTVTLDIIDDSYYIAYQRCCRNNTILNLVNAAETGAAFTTEISPDAQRTCNNSPVFEGLPPVLLCVNRPLKYDNSAIDIDGDSLVYEFITPLTAGGPDGASPFDCRGVRPSPLFMSSAI